MKRSIVSLISLTLGMVLVCASFAMAAETPVCGHSIQEEEKVAQTAEIKATEPQETQDPEVIPEPAQEPEEPEWITATATAYCSCEICCGKWAKNRPNGIVYTASGAVAQVGVTIAADWNIYPPGTVLYIEGMGERIVQDCGGAIKGQKIDVYFESHEEALQFGRQEVRFYIVDQK